MELSPLALYAIFVVTNGSCLLILVLFTIYNTPWFERIVTDVRTDEKPHWALLGGLATIGLIVSKPFTQIGDWWSDVAFMVEMHKNKTCNAAETDLRLSFLA